MSANKPKRQCEPEFFDLAKVKPRRFPVYLFSLAIDQKSGWWWLCERRAVYLLDRDDKIHPATHFCYSCGKPYSAPKPYKLVR